MKVITVERAHRIKTSTSSKGNQVKWYKNGVWIKADSMGYEGLAEEIGTVLLNHIFDVPYVPYYTCKIQEGDDEYPGCYCENVLKEGESFITFARAIESGLLTFEKYERHVRRLSTIDKIRFVVSLLEESHGINTLQYITNCLCLDSIILNEDRHLNNLCIIQTGRENRFIEAPIFDNGLSLLADLKDYGSLPIHKAIRKVTGRPFNTDFKRQVTAARELGGKPLRIDLKNLNIALEDYSNLIYPLVYADRAKNVIDYNLDILEGLAWVPI